MVTSLAQLGRFAEAIKYEAETIRLAEPTHHAFTVGQAYRAATILHLLEGDWAKARSVCEHGIAVVRTGNLELGESSWMRASQSRTVVTLGEISLAADRLDEAAALATRALALTRQYGQRGWEAGALRLLAEVASRQRPADVVIAEAHYRAALAIAEDLGMRPFVARCHLGLGSLLKHQPREAQDHLAVATASFREMGMQFWLEQATASSAAAR